MNDHDSELFEVEKKGEKSLSFSNGIQRRKGRGN